MVAVLTIGVIGFALDRIMLALQSAFTHLGPTLSAARPDEPIRRQLAADLELRRRHEVVYGADERRRGAGGIDSTSPKASSSPSSASRARGKTTLISLLAGLTRPTAGQVLSTARQSTGPGPDRGVVFQSYSLMPWLSVDGNVALAVDAVHKGRSTGRERASASRTTSSMVGLAPRCGSPASRALGRHAPARGRGARARDAAGRSCCSTSRSRRSTR